jgi:C-lobe and N-lobe beta barrels of Tf-binding protein B
MKTSKRLLPSVIALCLVGGVQSVSASTDCVETGGSGDSVNEWGIWCGVGSFLQAITEADAPAAGPGVDAGDVDTRDVGRSDSGTFDPNVNTPAPEPEAPQPLALHIQLPETGEGEFVGYFSSTTRDREKVPNLNKKGNPKKNNWNKIKDETSYNGVGGVNLGLRNDGKKNDLVDVALTSPEGGEVLSESIEGRSKDDPTSPPGETHKTVVNIKGDTEASTAVAWDQVVSGELASPGGKTSDRTDINLAELDDAGLLKDYWNGRLEKYSYQKEFWESFDQQNEDYNIVAGTLTPLDDITSMISGDVTASYRGSSAAFGQSVNIDVDFGNESFNASVSGGNGLPSDMSFTADGVIQGQHLISTSVSADSGYMQGSFFGPDADVVGGAYEVTKGTDTVGDVFTASKNVLR